jgi:hypothetical protein
MLRQRTVLKIMLVANLLMLVRPPFERHAGYRTLDLGYQWLWFALTVESSGSVYDHVRINFVDLAAQMVIVTLVGTVALLLMRHLSGRTNTTDKQGE